MTDPIGVLMAAIDRSMPPMPEAYRDWTYYDIPRGHWLTTEAWQMLLGVMGEGQYKVLAQSSRPDSKGVICHRGQFWISPRGKANMLAYANEKDPS